MSYYFKAEKMSVGYNKEPLIENIEFGLEKGEILTLIGPNGAGKSTILKSIARQLSLLGGTVYLDEKCVEKMSGSELSKSMSVVLTEKLRTEMMTCEEVVETGRYPYTGHFGILSEADHRAVKEAMELVQVSSVKDRNFSNISDGQRQRVMLARALCQEPDIIILDEPTSFLDVRYKLEFLSILQEMKRKRELTVIMSLHELELAERVSDKILCINGKYVDRFGSPEEIFEPGYINKLFSVSSGTFDEINGNMELAPAKGEAEVFVIAGGGTGRNVYRRLQRQGVAFVTGILFKNDLDYPVAKALAAEVIEADSFEPITEECLEAAKRRLKACKKVICCRDKFGTLELANRELSEYAVQCKSGDGGQILWQK
jgi:iron complex transport system ATP-binding protein